MFLIVSNIISVSMSDIGFRIHLFNKDICSIYKNSDVDCLYTNRYIQHHIYVFLNVHYNLIMHVSGLKRKKIIKWIKHIFNIIDSMILERKELSYIKKVILIIINFSMDRLDPIQPNLGRGRLDLIWLNLDQSRLSQICGEANSIEFGQIFVEAGSVEYSQISIATDYDQIFFRANSVEVGKIRSNFDRVTWTEFFWIQPNFIQSQIWVEAIWAEYS